MWVRGRRTFDELDRGTIFLPKNLNWEKVPVVEMQVPEFLKSLLKTTCGGKNRGTTVNERQKEVHSYKPGFTTLITNIRERKYRS